MLTTAPGRGPQLQPGAPVSRIIFLTQLFDPEPTIKGLAFVRALTDRGIEVEVVTGFPNYPGGRIYPGWRKVWRRAEVMEGIPITRLATYMSHDTSAVKRILCYASFYVTAVIHLLFRARRADLVYVYYPTLTAGLAAVTARLFRRTPILLDIQDMWPDSLGASGMMTNRYLLGFAHFLCGVLYRNCAHIQVQSPGFKRLLVERGVPADKITVVYNWADETAGLPEMPGLPAGFTAQDGLRVLFAGNMGAAQGLPALLEAAALVQQARGDVTFLMMGGGTERAALEAQAARLGLRNLRFLPRVPIAEVQTYLAAADVLVVHLKDQPLFRVTIPSKTQAYLFAGRAVLMAAIGDAADLVVQAGAGLAAVPENPQSLADRVLELASMTPEARAAMGARGRAFYDARLSMQQALDTTAALVKAHWRGGGKAR